MSQRITFDRCTWPLLAVSAGPLMRAACGPLRLFAVSAGSALTLRASFFGDPERRVPVIPGAAASPPDGAIAGVSAHTDAEAGPLNRKRFAIFRSMWDVHANRDPQKRLVETPACPHGGQAFACGHSAAKNESNWIDFRWNHHQFVVRQVAGKFTWRVVCRVNAGDRVQRGPRLGMIQFVSRTDLPLPSKSRRLVRVGGRVWGGSSMAAMLPGPGSGCPQ